MGADNIEEAGNNSDDNGGPGVHCGAARCDGHQASQGTVAHAHDVVHDALVCACTTIA
jgi:hypothetical protein